MGCLCCLGSPPPQCYYGNSLYYDKVIASYKGAHKQHSANYNYIVLSATFIYQSAVYLHVLV